MTRGTNMRQLDKSRYVEYALCPRKAWYELFNPLPVSKEETARQQDGIKAGILARDYFGKDACIEANQLEPQTESGIYYEYPLRFRNILCICDLLRINEDGSIDIFEVKAVNDIYTSESQKNIEPKFLEDVSFQYYVATLMNKNIRSVNLMFFNEDYIYDGKNLIINRLFTTKDMTQIVKDRIYEVELKVAAYFDLDKDSIPGCPFSKTCHMNNENCQYLDRCKLFKGLPATNSTFQLYKTNSKFKYIEEGIKTFEDVVNSEYWETLSHFNKVMIDTTLNNKSTYVCGERLKRFLDTIKYPAFFFDFETCQETFPKYPNSRPYSQIPFQYSLHIIRDPIDSGKEVCDEHKEFLGDGINDPREDLIIQMLSDLEKEGSIIAYHASFEMSRIKELARDFPKYAKELLDLLPRFIDLEDVFHQKETVQVGVYKRNTKDHVIGEPKFEDITFTCLYSKDMGNSCSIKHVLPAFFPNRPDLDYTKLSQVHHGGEAIEAYKELATLTGSERNELISNMLKYCCLDTKAMVVLYLKFIELANS